MTVPNAQLRELSALAYLFGPSRERTLRVVTRDGEVHLGMWAQPLYDVLVLGQRGNAVPKEIPLAEVQRFEWRELRLGRVATLGAIVVAVGALAGSAIQAQWGDPEMANGVGTMLGTILGAFAAPVVVWLLQNRSLLTHWQIWQCEPAA